MKTIQFLLITTLIIFLVGCAKQAQTGLPPVPKTSGEPTAAQPTSKAGSADLTLDLPSGKFIASGMFDTATKMDIAARVMNSGTGDSGEFTVAIYANDDKIYETTMSLTGGGKKVVEYLWKPPAAGNYKLKLAIDSNNDVSETDEKNNIFEIPIPVTEPQE